MNTEVPEEEGGPFIITSAHEQFAEGTYESNPAGSEREALPTAMRGAKDKAKRKAK